jgi:chromosomal replication initiator protein
MSLRSNWQLLGERLRAKLSPEEYSAWIAPLRVARESDDELVLAAPNARFVHTVEENYRGLLDREAAALGDELFQVVLTAGDEPAGAAAEPVAEQGDPASRLNPKYTFETFVVGSSNQFAHAAARAVGREPGAQLQPAVPLRRRRPGQNPPAARHRPRDPAPPPRPQGPLPGRRAVRQRAHQLAPLQVACRLPRALSRHRRAARRRHPVPRQQGADAGGVLPHLQHALHQPEADHPLLRLLAAQHPGTRGALAQRFEWGLIADIQPPDLETKIAILRRKADLDGAELPDDVALFVAHQVRSNVRELEGLLNRVVAFASLSGLSRSRSTSPRRRCATSCPTSDRRLSSAEIIKFVARHYGLKVSEIKSEVEREADRLPAPGGDVPVQAADRVCPIPEIGRQFNDKHHSTVMYSVDKIEQLRTTRSGARAHARRDDPPLQLRPPARLAAAAENCRRRLWKLCGGRSRGAISSVCRSFSAGGFRNRRR